MLVAINVWLGGYCGGLSSHLLEPITQFKLRQLQIPSTGTRTTTELLRLDYMASYQERERAINMAAWQWSTEFRKSNMLRWVCIDQSQEDLIANYLIIRYLFYKPDYTDRRDDLCLYGNYTFSLVIVKPFGHMILADGQDYCIFSIYSEVNIPEKMQNLLYRYASLPSNILHDPALQYQWQLIILAICTKVVLQRSE